MAGDVIYSSWTGMGSLLTLIYSSWLGIGWLNWLKDKCIVNGQVCLAMIGDFNRELLGIVFLQVVIYFLQLD